MATMKAIRIHEYGNADVLRYEDAERPEPGDGEVLVRVVAAGVNPMDWKTRAGFMKAMTKLAFPWIPGGDFSGKVAKVGGGLTDLREGHEVFGKADLPRNGSYAEYVVVPRSALTHKPRMLDHVHAAAVPLPSMTAYQSLFGNGGTPSLELAEGQRLLILGAAGGVGSFALQFAKAKGAYAIALGRPAQAAHLRALGADQVVDAEHFDEVGEVDAVLDLLGGELQERGISYLKHGGAVASTLGPPSAEEAAARNARTVSVLTRTSAQQLDEITKQIDAGKVKVVVTKTFPLAEAKQAHELLEHGSVQGKVVLSIGAA